MVNEQSVEYWDAFQNSRVDHDKIIFFMTIISQVEWIAAVRKQRLAVWLQYCNNTAH